MVSWVSFLAWGFCLPNRKAKGSPHRHNGHKNRLDPQNVAPEPGDFARLVDNSEKQA
jgi:hypothetical protein